MPRWLDRTLRWGLFTIILIWISTIDIRDWPYWWELLLFVGVGTVLSVLLAFPPWRWAEARHWNREHRRAWEGFDHPGPDGLTPFQVGMEARVLDVLEHRGAPVTDRRVLGDEESYVLVNVASLNAQVWIYETEAHVNTYDLELRLEEWDTKTPEEHYSRVTEFLESLPSDPPALTNNERLCSKRLIDDFDEAARSGDFDKMVLVLLLAGVEDPESIADTVLKHPGRYGY